MKANDEQIGGTHYKKGGEEHWDRAYRLGYDPFQYIITKWIERWKEKGGVEDLRKARHAIDKYIEVAKAEEAKTQGRKAGVVVAKCGRCGRVYDVSMGALSRRDNKSTICSECGTAEALEDMGPGPGYINQD